MSEAGRNLAMLLTPPGSGAIAVIRLSGPANPGFAAAHLSRPPKVGRCVHADLREGDQTIDDIVVVQSDAEEFDLNVHGGPYVTQAVMNLAERFGYTLAEWQHEPENALDAVDEIERQVLVDLPRASSEVILRLLTAQPAAWAAMLASNDQAAMRQAVADVTLERALAIPTVAIVGPPNVGKSTLANALFGQQRSITADRPGTTRDWVGELADVDGLIVQLIDTPGVRQTADAIEAQSIRQAGNVINTADCVIIALDGSRPLDAEEKVLLRRWGDFNKIIVRTKSDRPLLCDAPNVDLNLSAATGEGLQALRLLLHQRLGVIDLHSRTARCWTEAQRQTLRSVPNPVAG